MRTRYLTLSILLMLSGLGTAAYAQPLALEAGTYKLTVGAKAPCDVTVTADGAFTPAANCVIGATPAKWVPAGSGYKLLTPAGDIYAVLKPHGEDALQGMSFGVSQDRVVVTR